MTSATAPARAPFTPLLLLLFAGSGCAALIYEVVWFHLLRLVVGSSAVSIGCLLASFMGGMGLGSWLLPRLLSPRLHPLRVYALLELLIGAAGYAMPRLLPDLGRVYVEAIGHNQFGVLLRGGVCAVALLLPTLCMGATLPAISRWLDTSRAGIAAMGRFYGANIAGAVTGTLLAGFWLLRVHDTVVATRVAVAINVAVAVLAVLLAFARRHRPPAAAAVADAPAEAAAPARPCPRTVLVAIALSGATALGAEVVWTRLLSLLFGASVYTFSLILAVFLVGLGLGSAVGARLAARVASPWLCFAVAQALLAPAFLYSGVMIAKVVPWLEPTYVFKAFVYERNAVRFPWDAARCALAILPGTLLWGASFPLALAAAGDGQRDAGRLVGAVSAANTAGAIAGALLTSLVAIGAFGSQPTQQGLAAVGGLTALLLVTAAPAGLPKACRFACGALVLLTTAGAAWLLPPVPPGLIAYGRSVADWSDGSVYLHVAEGTNSSVAITETLECRQFHVSGKCEASTGYTDMRLQRMLGHLPALAHGDPKRVLIVGCGAGVTAGTFTAYPGIERIVICEMEPQVIEVARRWMAAANGGVLDDPRTEVVFDDARHYLATTREQFDVITSDPIHPWVRGAAMLYTLDYHQLVRQHLRPGGVVTQWVPLYQTDMASVQSQIGTFCRAFPEATVWNSDASGQGYDVALMAGLQPLHLDVDGIDERLDADPALRALLAPYDLGSALDLLRTYAGRAQDLQPWLVDAQLNEDTGLRLQYLAGLAVDRYQETRIYAAMLQHWRWPADLFTGSPARLQELRAAFPR